MTHDEWPGPSSADGPGAPLTFGQLSVLRINETYPLDRWSETYLPHVMSLPAEITFDRLHLALAGIARSHETLRTRFVDGDGGPRQLVDPVARVEVVVAERPGCTRPAALALLRTAAGRRFSSASEFGWRVLVVTDNDRPTHLGLVFDHIVADRWGSGRLIVELRTALGIPDPAGEKWAATPSTQPRELALLQRSDRWTARRDGATKYWQNLLDTLPADAFPIPAPPGPDDAGRIEAILHSSRACAALATAAERSDVSQQTVMLALTALAVHHVVGTDPVVLTLQASNRYGALSDVVSSMNQYTPMMVRIPSADQPFVDFARTVHWSGITAYRHGSYDVDAIWRMVAHARGAPPNFDHFFNFIGVDVNSREPADADPAAERVEWHEPRRQIGPRFDVKIRGGPELELVVRADPTLIDKGALEKLMWWFNDTLLRLASHGPSRVGDLTVQFGP